MIPVRILVAYREGVLDPAAQAVERSLHGLGFDGARDVRLAKQIDLTLEATDADEALKLADDMCKRLLVNEVIETYRLHVQRRAGRANPSDLPQTSAQP